MNGDRIREIEIELARLAATREELEHELALLASGQNEKQTTPLPNVEERISLFLRMFRCRESVYPRYWENRTKGTSGYSPTCDNEWVRGVCGKPPHGRVRCSECPNQAFPDFDEGAARAHLDGRAVIGTYAIREDDTCVFLACDFDGSRWKEDALLYQRVATELGAEALVERSRSGAGAHVWIFFDGPVPARMARALGTMILARCGESDHQLGLESFDRFFPNQDYLPKGGFGNLIALPFQRAAVEKGNTLFIDESLLPFEDQWAVLAGASRISIQELNRILGSALVSRKESPEDDLSLATHSKIIDRYTDVRGLLPKGTPVMIEICAQISIPLNGLPPKLITALQRLATFANPEFFKLQRMRMPTYPQPRFIFSGEKRPDLLLTPRGLAEKVQTTLEKAGAIVTLTDRRVIGPEQTLNFKGLLTDRQQMAATDLLKCDSGIYVAPPGTGKTVVACVLVGARKTSTLVLVHKQPLMDQWREEIGASLGLNPKQIGTLGGAKKKRTGIIDVAMLQSLVRSPNCAEILSEYGFVIIDECHHIPAASFESVMKQCAAKYILGLTATPKRKDGLEMLLHQQCGPIRHEIEIDEIHSCPKAVIIRETRFKQSEQLVTVPPYHQLAHSISTDSARNAMIGGDIASALEQGRFPLVLADRKEQIHTLEKLVGEASGCTVKTHCLEGSLSAKARRQVLVEVTRARDEGRPVALFATASLVGEGFNLPELDTLFLAAPISFEGRLIQYVGRLQRAAAGKSDVRVFDYVDVDCPIFLKMFRKRIKTYYKLGYDVLGAEVLTTGEQQLPLF